ncbi:GNAT family N-acetyltransferase [Kytococcus sp. Marseille-QA3725]
MPSDLPHLPPGYRVDRAVLEDVSAIVALLCDDPLGATREGDDMAPYVSAFRAIDADPAHFLAVVRSAGGSVVGTMQLTLVPGLSRGGLLRLQIEGVRIAEGERGGGLGAVMMRWAHAWGPVGARAWCSSRRIVHGAMRTASTSDWGTRPRTSG